MLKKTLMILLVLLIPSVAALAETPAEPPLTAAPRVDAPAIDTEPAVESEAQATAEPTETVSGGFEPEVVFLGSCPGGSLSSCYAICQAEAEQCHATCGSPVCNFYCRQENRNCLTACDTLC